jgi:hypothetical protein
VTSTDEHGCGDCTALLANDTDVDGDTLTVASVQGTMGGTVALMGGNVVFTPTANFSEASFTYTVVAMAAARQRR